MNKTRLQTALENWFALEENTPALFSEITGIDRSVVSRLKRRPTGFTQEQRVMVVEGFDRHGKLDEGLILLRADLEDAIPPHAHPHMRVEIIPPAILRERPRNRRDDAKNALLEALLREDQDTIALALGLHTWDNRRKSPPTSGGAGDAARGEGGGRRLQMIRRPPPDGRGA